MIDKLSVFLAQFSTADSLIQAHAMNKRQTHTFQDEQTINAVVTWWTNDFHPTALYFATLIRPGHKALNPTVLQFVKDIAQGMNLSHLVIREYAPVSPFVSWLLTQNFIELRRTVMPTLTLATTPTTNAGAMALSFNQLSESQKQQLLTMSYTRYQTLHARNPVMAYNESTWQSTAFTDLIPDAPLLIWQNNKIQAYCLVYEDGPSLAAWGWMDGSDTALLALQQEQISWLQSRYTTLQGEFDSTDSIADQTRQHWPFAPAPVAIIYLATR